MICGLLVALLSAGATFLFPLKYRADADVFIISQSRQGVDPYTTVKSAERIGENLAQIVGTDDFFAKVMEQEGFGIDAGYFAEPTNRKRRKLWQKTVDASVVFGTGVFRLSAYHEDPGQASRLVAAAGNALVTQGWQYVGGDVIIKLVNEPVVSPFPVKPHVLVNAFLGFLIGLILSGVLLIRRR